MNWLSQLLHPQRLSYSVATEKGPREENQDNYLIRQPSGQFEMLKDEAPILGKSKAKTNGWWRFAVMDGMGGHNGGRQISERLAALLAHAPTATGVAELKNLLLALHDTLYHEFHFDHDDAAPGTTLVIAEISPKNEAVIAHIGDSRMYRKPVSQSWQALTQDHTASTFKHRLHPQDALTHAINEPLAQAVGFGSFGVFVDDKQLIKQYHKNIRLDITGPSSDANDVKLLKCDKNEQLLLASDGIWHTEEHHERPLPDAIDTAEELVHYAINSDSRDNTTAILLTF